MANGKLQDLLRPDHLAVERAWKRWLASEKVRSFRAVMHVHTIALIISAQRDHDMEKPYKPKRSERLTQAVKYTVFA